MTGPITNSNGQIQRREDSTDKKPKTPSDKLAEFIKSKAHDIATALPKHINPDRISRIVLTAVRLNPKLAECDLMSFMGCVLTAAQLGLEVNTPLGHAYLIPFKRKQKDPQGNWNELMYCQLIIGYQGMIELAQRSGSITSIYAFPVYEGDQFSYQLGLHPDLKHIPSEDDRPERKRITHVYAVAHKKEGPPLFTVMTWAEVVLRQKRSRSANDGPWVTDTEAMALKTVIRKFWKWLPKSVEMQRVGAIDEYDDVNVKTSQITTFDPEVAAALEKQGLALQEANDSAHDLADIPENNSTKALSAA